MIIDSIDFYYEYLRLSNLKGALHPLMDLNVKIDINVRIEIQKLLFGSKNIKTRNSKFCKWIWEHKSHYCEESGIYLPNYSISYCSHIMSRGAHPEKAIDPRNINILTLENHNKWEVGNRKSMKIYTKNQQIIDLLNDEYQL